MTGKLRESLEDSPNLNHYFFFIVLRYSWKNHGSNKLPNKINPRIVVSYHRAIPPKNFVATNGVKWFKKRMCYLVGQKCPILISYSGNEQPFRSNTSN